LLNERRRRVLQALVAEYISSATPVGSKHLVDHYELGCSPATVRNELAILEETGYLFQPHVSAGRVPTDTGYRSFVDDLLARQAQATDTAMPLDAFRRASEVDELMREATSLLSRITDYMAVVAAPTVSYARIRRVNLLSLAPRRVIVVLITDAGQVENRQVEIAEPTTPERIADVERSLNASLVGKRACDIRPLRDAVASERHHPSDALIVRLMDELLDCLDEADNDRLFHVGVPTLLGQPEFHDAERVRPLLVVVEDGAAMLDTLSDALGADGVTVRIGSENRREELGNVSIVATHYSASDADGVVGVIGPTRMDYTRAIAAVRTVAEKLEDTLG
jgi:heat-inducible transcriptional repressor